MSTVVDSGYPTIQNVVSRLDPEGKIAPIVDLLTKKVPILQDIPWKEGNLPTGHLVVSRQGLPSPTWRKLNLGIAATKSDTQKFTESCGMLEALSKVDVDVAELNGNSREFRFSEDAAQLEGMAQEMSRAIFYENAATNQERIHGLAARYAASSGYTASSYVFPLGTLSGTNCESIWLLNWNPEKMCGIYPKASMGGIKSTDMGVELVRDASNNEFRAYRTHYQWKAGIMVADYRYAARLQWDPDDTSNYPNTGKQLLLDMQNAYDSVYDMEEATSYWYMSRTSVKKFDAQVLSNENRLADYIERGGKRLRTYMGIPIRVTDTLVGETAIT